MELHVECKDCLSVYNLGNEFCYPGVGRNSGKELKILRPSFMIFRNNDPRAIQERPVASVILGVRLDELRKKAVAK